MPSKTGTTSMMEWLYKLRTGEKWWQCRARAKAANISSHLRGSVHVPDSGFCWGGAAAGATGLSINSDSKMLPSPRVTVVRPFYLPSSYQAELVATLAVGGDKLYVSE